jgi:hypothetical protein
LKNEPVTDINDAMHKLKQQAALKEAQMGTFLAIAALERLIGPDAHVGPGRIVEHRAGQALFYLHDCLVDLKNAESELMSSKTKESTK